MALHPIHELALCSGIGGISLGLKLALGDRHRTVCHVERDSYAAAVLVARMEDEALDYAPVWDCLETFDGAAWRGCVDIVTAGYPCQGFSSAARGRHKQLDLWPQVKRIVKQCQPSGVFLENVSHAQTSLTNAGRDLLGMGFRVAGLAGKASGVGAPYARTRLFLLAVANGNSESVLSVHDETSGLSCGAGPWYQIRRSRNGRVAYGPSRRMERLRAVGNAVVPVVAAKAFLSLAKCLPRVKTRSWVCAESHSPRPHTRVG